MKANSYQSNLPQVTSVVMSCRLFFLETSETVRHWNAIILLESDSIYGWYISSVLFAGELSSSQTATTSLGDGWKKWQLRQICRIYCNLLIWKVST